MYTGNQPKIQVVTELFYSVLKRWILPPKLQWQLLRTNVCDIRGSSETPLLHMNRQFWFASAVFLYSSLLCWSLPTHSSSHPSQGLSQHPLHPLHTSLLSFSVSSSFYALQCWTLKWDSHPPHFIHTRIHTHTFPGAHAHSEHDILSSLLLSRQSTLIWIHVSLFHVQSADSRFVCLPLTSRTW